MSRFDHNRESSSLISRRTLMIGLALPSTLLIAKPSRASTWKSIELPDIRRRSYANLAGTSNSLENISRYPILLNLWATWCAPCVIELPALDRVARDMADKLCVVALSVDRGPASHVGNAVDSLKLKHLNLLLDPSGRSISDLSVPALPSTYFISKKGKSSFFMQGRVDWDSADQRNGLNRLIRNVR